MLKTVGALAAGGLLLVGVPAWGQDLDDTAPPVVDAQLTPYPLVFFAPYSPVTASDLVGRIPGFQVDDGDNSRGLAGAAGNVLIDGQRPPGKTNIWDILSRLRANQVERIDLIRGGAPGIDMQGKALVINIIRVPQVGGYSHTIEVGGVWIPTADRLDGALSFTAQRETAGGARFDGELHYNRAIGEAGTPGGTRLRTDPGGSVIQDVSSQSSDAYANLSARLGAEFGLLGGKAILIGRVEDTSDSRRSTEWFNGTERLTERVGAGSESGLEARYSYAPSGGGQVQAAFTQEWEESASNTVSLSGRPPTDHVSEGEAGTFDASVDYPISPRLRSLTVLARSWNSGSSSSSSLRAGGALSRETDTQESGETALRSTLFFKPRATLSLEAGAEGAYNFLEGASEIAFGGVAVPVPGSQAKVDEKRGEVFAVAIWLARPYLTVEGAVRQEFSTLTASGLRKDLAFTKPMIQARWQLEPQRQLTARVERQVGQLDFGDFLSSASISEFEEVITAGAADLTPPQTWVSSLQFDQQFWDTGVLKLRAEHRAINDIIDIRPIVTANGTFEATGNIGDGHQAWFNASVDAPLDNLGVEGARLSLNANILLLSELTDPFTGETRRFGWDTDHNLSADYEHEIRRWKTTWGFNVWTQAERYSYRSNSVEVSEQSPNLSAYAIYRPDARSTVRLDLRNIGPGHSESRREVYLGRRDITELNYVEHRRNDRATSVRLTWRRMHG